MDKKPAQQNIVTGIFADLSPLRHHVAPDRPSTGESTLLPPSNPWSKETLAEELKNLQAFVRHSGNAPHLGHFATTTLFPAYAAISAEIIRQKDIHAVIPSPDFASEITPLLHHKTQLLYLMKLVKVLLEPSEWDIRPIPQESKMPSTLFAEQTGPK
jgi:hypothetical protein